MLGMYIDGAWVFFLDLTEKGLIGSQIRSSNTAIKHTKLMRPSIVYMIVVCLAIYG